MSNLFEFTTFFGMSLVGAFILIYFMYRLPILGLFALPIAVLVIAYASMFSRDISPLIPALQSDWLKFHVTTAAVGEAIWAISFVSGLMYLPKAVNQSPKSRSTFWLEIIMFGMHSTVGFVLVTIFFTFTGYQSTFTWTDKMDMEGNASL